MPHRLSPSADTGGAADRLFGKALDLSVEVQELRARLAESERDVARMNRLEWADTVLLCREDEDDPQRRFSFRDMATPPTAENPDGTIYGPTVRAVLDAALTPPEPT